MTLLLRMELSVSLSQLVLIIFDSGLRGHGTHYFLTRAYEDGAHWADQCEQGTPVWTVAGVHTAWEPPIRLLTFALMVVCTLAAQRADSPHPESLSSSGWWTIKLSAARARGRQWAWLGGEGLQKQRRLY